MDPFLAQLKALCTALRTRGKWVFVPADSVGRALVGAHRGGVDPSAGNPAYPQTAGWHAN